MGRIANTHAKTLDSARNAVQLSACGDRLLRFCFWLPTVGAGELHAYESAACGGSQLGRGALNHIVTITGRRGNPQPRMKIVLEDPQSGGARELQIAAVRSIPRIDRMTPQRVLRGSNDQHWNG